jgi:hypothetical protein
MVFRKYTFILAILILLIVPLSFSEVIVFDNYKTTYSLEGNVLKVKKELRLKNVGTNPIIPGEIHFRITQNTGDEYIAPIISNFDVENARGRSLETKQIKKDNEVDLIFTIWDPLLPNFHYDFYMEYEISFDPKGILFYSINIPNEKTTIPIKRNYVEFYLAKKYHITYAPYSEDLSSSKYSAISFEDPKNVEIEYSFLPLPKTSFHMVNLFWIIAIIIFILIFIIRLKRYRDA